jgi:hypothetical protein
MPFSYNIKDYIRVYHGFLDPALCASTIKSLQKAKWQKHEFVRTADNTAYSNEDDLYMCWDDLPERDIIMKRLWFGIEQYINKDFAHCAEWFHGWAGYNPVRFNRYDVGTKMKIHCDHITSMFDGQRKGIPTLSIVGALNDDYEGGDFMMWNEKLHFPAGALLVFPSNFMFPHMVSPVTKGARYSYVSWVW